MVSAKATVEAWVDTPCASWVVGGGIWDVERSLYCDATEMQLWLIFTTFLTAYCVSSRIFDTIRNS